MSSLSRIIIGTVILISVTVLVLVHYSDANLTLAVGMYGTILGYVFGNTNGEKALATSILQAQANALNPNAPVSAEVYNAAVEKVLPSNTPTLENGDNAKSLPLVGP